MPSKPSSYYSGHPLTATPSPTSQLEVFNCKLRSLLPLQLQLFCFFVMLLLIFVIDLLFRIKWVSASNLWNWNHNLGHLDPFSRSVGTRSCCSLSYIVKVLFPFIDWKVENKWLLEQYGSFAFWSLPSTSISFIFLLKVPAKMLPLLGTSLTAYIFQFIQKHVKLNKQIDRWRSSDSMVVFWTK